MKLRTIKGDWIVIHNGREINFRGCALAAIDYCLTMKKFMRQIVLPKKLYPVKSLVPHPKKRRVTKKWRERIITIKRNYELGVYGE